MFTAVPCLKDVFNGTNQAVGKQPGKLFATVAEAAVSCVEDRDFDENMALSICHKHCALNIQGNQYGVVAEHLLGTISEKLTDDQRVLGAWAELYGELANKCMSIEQSLYKETEEKEGGWTGMREFFLAERTIIADGLARIRFEPVDGKKVCSFRNGQYTTVWAKQEGWSHRQPRHYTLASPGDEGGLTITVRKQGLMSNLLHEIDVGEKFELSAPYGAFDMSNLEALWLRDPSVPVVFLSAGVGITPILSMLEQVADDPTGPVVWLHASKRGANHPYRTRLLQIARENDWMTRRVWYETPQPVDFVNPPSTEENLKKFHFEGRMNFKDVEDLIPFGNKNVYYYFCGPPGFMEWAVKDLTENYGISKDRLMYESF